MLPGPVTLMTRPQDIPFGNVTSGIIVLGGGRG